MLWWALTKGYGSGTLRKHSRSIVRITAERSIPDFWLAPTYIYIYICGWLSGHIHRSAQLHRWSPLVPATAVVSGVRRMVRLPGIISDSGRERERAREGWKEERKERMEWGCPSWWGMLGPLDHLGVLLEYSPNLGSIVERFNNNPRPHIAKSHSTR